MAKAGDVRDQGKCSFCGKTREQVWHLVAGPGVSICDACVVLCNELLEEDRTFTRRHVTVPLRGGESRIDV